MYFDMWLWVVGRIQISWNPRAYTLLPLWCCTCAACKKLFVHVDDADDRNDGDNGDDRDDDDDDDDEEEEEEEGEEYEDQRKKQKKNLKKLWILGRGSQMRTL